MVLLTTAHQMLLPSSAFTCRKPLKKWLRVKISALKKAGVWDVRLRGISKNQQINLKKFRMMKYAELFLCGIPFLLKLQPEENILLGFKKKCPLFNPPGSTNKFFITKVFY